MENSGFKKVNLEDVCDSFERVSYSLIEEPEVCEWCEYYDDRCGVCKHED